MRIRDIDQAMAAGPLCGPAQSRFRTRAPLLQRMAHAVGDWLRRMVQYLVWRQHVAALQRLDDATLRDIGVQRTNIEFWVAEQHPIARAHRARQHEDPWVCEGCGEAAPASPLRETDIYR
jgi:uncharacterized protein YjiS (DUF1127 family)